MERKAITGIMLTLLLVSMLTLAFNVPPVVAENGIAGLLNECSTFQNSFLYDGSKNHSLDRNTLAEENSSPFSIDEDKWNFNRTNEWADFAKVDGDSAELVIGVNNGKQKSYADMVGLICESGGELVDTVSMRSEIQAVVADLPFDTLSSFVMKTRTAGLSRYIEPNMEVQAYFVPNDPYWPQQWGPVKIEADYAWNTTIGDPSVLVAVIDTGIDYNHPDLAANYVALGYDWVNIDTDPMDDNGHGTHCAGIIAAVTNNSLGIAGLAQVQIMAEKVLNQYGRGSIDGVAKAIVHAVDQGADILSMSLGSYDESELLHEAVTYAYDSGALLVAAAGNDATSDKSYPSAYDEVIAVTATDQSDNPSSWPRGGGTNFGEWVEVAAPGTNIYSTVSEVHHPYFTANYSYANGTSMACPCVAGVAALVWSQFPDMNRDQVRAQLRETSDDLGNPGFDIHYGYGRINARKAVEQALPNHDLLVFHWKKTPHVKPGNTVTVNTTILNFGTSDESNIMVQLLVNGSVADSVFIGFLASGTSAAVSCACTPAVEGIYNITSYVVPVPSETVTGNNALSGYVVVRGAKIFRVPEDYPTIQDAVDAAFSGWGDTIMVRGGIYYEDIIIKKKNNLTLIGENKNITIIDAGEEGYGIFIVEANNVKISGFTVKNAGWDGILISRSSGNAIIGNMIKSNRWGGISLASSTENVISGNIVTLHENPLSGAIELSNSAGNTISGNNITNNNQKGFVLTSWGGYLERNKIYGNSITNNYGGIEITWSRGNTIYHNNFINNTEQTHVVNAPNNVWDNGYPSGGNYWSDYISVDQKSGPNQDQLGSDGIGDYPYVIDANNRDRYPLMKPWTPPLPPYTLTIHSSPTGVTFTVDGVSHTTPWSGTYSEVTLVSLVMPETHDGYVWFHWLEDGDTNRIKTVIMDANITLTAVFRFLADLNSDGIVDIFDLRICAKAFGSKPEDINWNPTVDLNNDGLIDIFDLRKIAKHYLENI